MAEDVEATRVPTRTRGFELHRLCGMLKPKQHCLPPIYPIDYRYGLNRVALLPPAKSAANIRARLSYHESLLQELQPVAYSLGSSSAPSFNKLSSSARRALGAPLPPDTTSAGEEVDFLGKSIRESSH
ncbi:hypothetical protein FOZ60_001517 [Perkinsus olseni]|uniref:Uncharacterized protein n=1 Tax=Perkinsus olseni TaxID=32597 RepID=A0A7J6P0B0_PEROL|nr:hypothetical protein FOZ60_001517 [Perkinsus olseni]